MILHALYEYYNRSKRILPAYGRELKEIGFLIVIDKNGRFLRFEDRRVNKNQAQQFLVKKHIGRSSAPVANYLYDNSAYVFGYSNKGDSESSAKNLAVFIAKVSSIYYSCPDNEDIKAVYNFYQQDMGTVRETMFNDSLWSEIEKNLNKKYSTFSFLIDGDTRIVAEKDELLDLLDDSTAESTLGCEDSRICLVSGQKGGAVETTTATMIPGSQATAKLVAFQVSSGYDSYGKVKGGNAPISEESEFAYTTALNYMLRSDSRNKFLIGNRTFLFWASKDDEAGKQTEDSVFSMFGFNEQEDDPNRKIEQVRKTFNAIYSGQLRTSLDDRFYILGLAPNSARIAVVYWSELPLKDFAALILKHFEDMSIVDTRKDPKPYFGLRSILSAVTLGGKSSDATPNLPEAVVKSIFQGISYPYTLFASCIRRIRAEQSINIIRAAIIKAYLNRQHNDNQQKIKTMLDKENINQGYLCGRLFAVLDKIQDEANNQHSIRERYMNAASATPAAVFATILNLSYHHSEKLNERRRVLFEKIKQEIVDKISADGFPSHLDLQDQGRFFVGYYQQMQCFYTKKEEQSKEE